jgi:hypothetical protein
LADRRRFTRLDLPIGPQRIHDGDQIHHLLGCRASDGWDVAERGLPISTTLSAVPS